MTALHTLHTTHGAQIAPDGVPLRYGDLADELAAARTAAVLMDRSHEGRVHLTGRDRLAIPHRLSTNAVETLKQGQAAPTLFLTPNGRIIDRVTVCVMADAALLLTEPGRAPAVTSYLQRNIFYNDELRVADVTAASRQFVLFGKAAAQVIAAVGVTVEPLHAQETTIDGVACVVVHDKPFAGDPDQAVWRVIVPSSGPDYVEATQVWSALLAAGAGHGLRQAGSEAYYALRVQAGRPGVNAELSGEYIPLEVGLWDEISFTKGCYTGQEIIARMESRRKLARTIVRVALDGESPAVPCAVSLEGREVGRITSASAGLGIAVVRLAAAQPGATLSFAGGSARIIARAGVQPETTEE